ncbi:MAG: RNA methyltransferase, TrmH family group 3 [candidate division WS6 bacterium GW2011_GWF2_39_15]|uniref:RNA methyltransferase, TrmH family group 3 n=1 Tax=candidate division WS6 bacterium GW2011_GWF2_39_15 TaxID=1619100 RepID=A0A0G0MPQ4_9BACT|nr:MAG: RNA methyltransferase, TrmH family group 3 [candidate division WS6 bacterium GW2011_GWF2_39_15]
MPRTKYIQIESKNALLELLREGKHFDKIYVALSAYKDLKTKEIVQIAGSRRVPIEKASRKFMDRLSKTSSIESVIGLMEADNMWRLDELLLKLHEEKISPFFILLDHIKYDQNIGAILRTAFGCGVNGIITPIKTENFLTNESLRISMGAAARIPIVEMNLFSALSEMKKEGIKVYGVSMEGREYYNTDLRGPAAFVMGAEDVGISPKVSERVDEMVSIPMREGLGSLNVGASTAIVCYEKLRQEVKGF